MLQSCLGLSFDPAANHVTFNEPLLPDFLDEVMLGGLSIGKAWIDVSLRRSGHQVVVEVVNRSGPIRVLATS
jgi:hypothetical protein